MTLTPPGGAAEAIAGFAGPLVTPRLTLHTTVPADAADLFVLFNDWEIVRWLGQPDWPQAMEFFVASINRLEVEMRAGQTLYLTVRAGDTIVGGVTWSSGDTGGGPIIGYWIGQPFWGRGYVTEAAGALCDYIFARTAEPVIHSGVFEGNAASLRVQHKLGFVESGVSMHFSVPRQQELRHIDTKLTRVARQVARERTQR